MPLGIYKPGQGYWVRVMTAIGVGVLVLAGASWAWAQAATIDLPTKNFIISVTAVTGDLTTGDQVELLRPAATIAEQDELVGIGDEAAEDALVDGGGGDLGGVRGLHRVRAAAQEGGASEGCAGERPGGS